MKELDSHNGSSLGEPLSTSLTGIGVSPGLAIGPALLFQPPAESRRNEVVVEEPRDAALEKGRLEAAVQAAISDLNDLAADVARKLGKDESGIFEAQALMLADPTITEHAELLIDRDQKSAETALTAAAEEQAVLLEGMQDPIWQQRAADVRDALRRALDHLQPASSRPPTLAAHLATLARPVVVVADDLTPSDTVQMSREQVRAIALVKGNATAHASILARALGIPAVVGLGAGILEATRAGDTLVVDGASGHILVRPTEVELEEAERASGRLQAEREAARAQQSEWRGLPGRTRDRYPVPCLANVGTVEEARAATDMGAEGIGLLRTEFLFSTRTSLPDEDEQIALYEAICSIVAESRVAGGLPDPIVIIRTLDAGADKPLPALEPYRRDLPVEENPALGVRGIRLQLRARELLTQPLRAVLRVKARTEADVRIMLPMISAVEELREARALLVETQHDLVTSGTALHATVPLGIMVETPAAVLAIRAMAREASFVSIGTNDLTQYVMAADRQSPALATLCRPTQPPVLQAVATVVEGAHMVGIHVGVCGEMAADPRLALVLVGLGVDELSMTPGSIPGVKKALAAHSIPSLRALAADVLSANTMAEVEETITRELP
jgi:phosphoenolpyruvate-protein phosphotransferase (PTS system enzyme I)